MNPVSPLPATSHLPVDRLSASFQDVTNSYKFYWFLSLLDYVQENQRAIIPVRQLITRMIAAVWYPTNYFRLSFGKQDRLSAIALAIRAETQLLPNTKRTELIQRIPAYLLDNSVLAGEIRSLAAYVPYRFLRPFFTAQLRSVADWKINNLIEDRASQSFISSNEPCLYRFTRAHDFSIEIHPLWLEYLRTNLPILRAFCMWHLLNYLQKNNPNVPNIAGKLFEPLQRDLGECRTFWKLIFDAKQSIRCIYSGEVIERTDFSLDHFLPWSFVTHDLLWNIVPVRKAVNSAKSDQLPDLKLYFEPFARQQYEAFQTIAELKKESLLEDYVLLFREESVQAVQSLSYQTFKGRLQETIAPQLQIAKNMGFTDHWSYRVL